MSGFFFAAAAAANVTVETPIDGQTGVWIKSAGVTINSAMKMTGVTVSNGQTQYIYDRGVASQYSVLGGTVYMSGGTAVDVYVEAFGYFHVSSGALLVGGTGGSGCRIRVSSGGVASLTSMMSNGAGMTVYPGGSVYQHTGDGSVYGYLFSALVPNAKRLVIIGGGTASDVLVSNGQLYISSGGVVYDTTIRGGTVVAFSDGVALNVTISGGSLTASSGGTATGVTASGGRFYASSGGVTVGGSVMSGGSGQALSGGTVSGMTVFASGRVDALAGGSVLAPVVSGGLVYMYTGGFVSGGTIHAGTIQGGGSAWDITVSSTGKLNLLANASGSGLTILSGGSLIVASGASALAVTSNAGAKITVSDGGYIEYA